ncbi:hypothetical protein [Flavobacterium sp.]|uniref:hypothetical protein n=1 Tax=Flavobacterium sp. TaxID=239 RepID=UPI0025BE5B3B|nr:hypothetical protein [Flavobacterium sp.]
MNYNYFTINYITALQKNLKIEIVNGDALFFPDYIQPEDLENLKTDLQEVWKHSESAITLLKNKEDAKIQLGLFGSVTDFDLALKTGYLLGDRVVIIDYLFERIINKKPLDQIDIPYLGSISSNLVLALELAKKGRFVIIPNPFSWNADSKKIIAETAEKTTMSVELMSLLNMLSITTLCKLQPYTIAESAENYERIKSEQISHTDAMGKTTEEYAYLGILGGLLTEKLINEAEFQILLDIPLTEYAEVISLQQNFYTEYLKRITFGGALKAENNIEELKKEVLNLIEERNKNVYKKIIEKAGIMTGIGGVALSLAPIMIAVSAPLVSAGTILAASGSIAGLFKSKELEGPPVINVFTKLIT